MRTSQASKNRSNTPTPRLAWGWSVPLSWIRLIASFKSGIVGGKIWEAANLHQTLALDTQDLFFPLKFGSCFYMPIPHLDGQGTSTSALGVIKRTMQHPDTPTTEFSDLLAIPTPQHPRFFLGPEARG